MEKPSYDLKDILSHTKGNELDILHSHKCSCLFCRQNYDARKVSNWSNEGNKISAVCPECGMTYVVGDASGYSFDHATLKEINESLFGEEYMLQHPESVTSYINRYREEKITHKKENEKLYLHYLHIQAENGDMNACYLLGEFYEFGSKFTEKNLEEALHWFTDPSLCFDGDSLTRAGVISLKLGFPYDAYEYFAKGMALGSSTALLHFSDCYMKGEGIPKDRAFAAKLLMNAYSKTTARFVASSGSDAADFASLCYRLGKAYEKGDGVQKNALVAIRMLLCAQYAYSLIEQNHHLIGELSLEEKDTKKRLEKLAKLKGYTKGDPVYDFDTFVCSLDPYSGMQGVYDSFIPNSINRVSYSEEERILRLTTDSVCPTLVIDPQNLFCGFAPNSLVEWEFEGVTSFSGLNSGSLYNRIVLNTENEMTFYTTFNQEDENLVGEITFEDRSENDNKEEEETGKA